MDLSYETHLSESSGTNPNAASTPHDVEGFRRSVSPPPGLPHPELDGQTCQHRRDEELRQAQSIHAATLKLKDQQSVLGQHQAELEQKAQQLVVTLAGRPEVFDRASSPITLNVNQSTAMSPRSSPLQRAVSQSNPELHHHWVPPEEDIQSSYGNFDGPSPQYEVLNLDVSGESDGESEANEDQEVQPNNIPINPHQAQQEGVEVNEVEEDVPRMMDPRRPMSYDEEYFANPHLVMLTNIRDDAPPVYPPAHQPCALCNELGTHYTNDCPNIVTLGERRRAISASRRCWRCLRLHRPPCRHNKSCPVCGSVNHCIVLCPRFDPDRRYYNGQG